MKIPFLLATTNSSKISEFRDFCESQNWNSYAEILDLKAFPSLPPVCETGTTFAENALLKAKAYFHHTKIPVFSDDSGLVVPSLGGKPGIYSARYAGPEANSFQNLQKLLEDMREIQEREAYFVSTLVYLKEPDLYVVSEGRCYGEIAYSARGKGGFGYDPIFFLPQKGKTMAELPLCEKQQLSHRAEAFRKIAPFVAGTFHASI